MKRAIRTIIAAVLCVALLLGLTVTASGSTSTIYLMAVNETVVDVINMTSGHLPMVVDGVLYVPYTMLSSRVTGINLGVNAQHSTTRRTVLVSSGQRGIIFDVQANTAYDIRNEPLDVRAVARNTMIYLPIAWICEYFGTISYTVNRTRYGTLVRVTNSAAILGDEDFIDAASNLLADNLARYQDSLRPASTPTPVPTPAPAQPTAAPAQPSTAPQPTATPKPSAAPQPSASPEPSDPVPSETPEPEEGPEVCLTFRWGDQAEQVAELLENAGQRALFLFAPEELADNDGLVRRLTAKGHTIGLVLTGETGEDCLSQAEAGSRLLAAIARCPALVVEADGLNEADQEELTQAGYILWTASIQGTDYPSASALMRVLSDQQTNLIGSVCDENGLVLVRNLLRILENANGSMVQATAPLLANTES